MYSYFVKEKAKKYELDEHKLSKALQAIQSKRSILFSMSGKMGAGKDTIGDLISNELINRNYKVINTSFGDLIRKEIAALLLLLKVNNEMKEISNAFEADIFSIKKTIDLMGGSSVYDRTENVREALQFWGTEVRRANNQNYWINKMANFIVNKLNKGCSINVTDARFPNEVKLIEDLMGKVIRLNVPESVRVERLRERDNINVSQDKLNHISEIILDDYQFEFELDGTRLPKEIFSDALHYILTPVEKTNEVDIVQSHLNFLSELGFSSKITLEGLSDVYSVQVFNSSTNKKYKHKSNNLMKSLNEIKKTVREDNLN